MVTNGGDSDDCACIESPCVSAKIALTKLESMMKRTLATAAIAALMLVPTEVAAGKDESFRGMLLGMRKTGEIRQVSTPSGDPVQTLSRYLMENRDVYDFVVVAEGTTYIGRIEIPSLAKRAVRKLNSQFPDNTPVHVRLERKGTFKKRMEMELRTPQNKKIALLLISVVGPDAVQQCRQRGGNYPALRSYSASTAGGIPQFQSGDDTPPDCTKIRGR